MGDTKGIKNGNLTAACYITIVKCNSVAIDNKMTVHINYCEFFRDTRRCLRYLAFYGTYTHFAFIGDFRIRELYYGFVGHLQQHKGLITQPPDFPKKNLSHTDNKLKIKVEYFRSDDISTEMFKKFRLWQLSKNPPSIIIAGCGLEIIRICNASKAIIQEYNVNLTRLVPTIDKLQEKKSRVLWALQGPVNVDKLPVQYQMVTNEQIDLINKEAIDVRFLLLNFFLYFHQLISGSSLFRGRNVVECEISSTRYDLRKSRWDSFSSEGFTAQHTNFIEHVLQ